MSRVGLGLLLGHSVEISAQVELNARRPRVDRAPIRGVLVCVCGTRRGRWEPGDSRAPCQERPSGQRGEISVLINAVVRFSLCPLIFLPLQAQDGEGGVTAVHLSWACGI